MPFPEHLLRAVLPILNGHPVAPRSSAARHAQARLSLWSSSGAAALIPCAPLQRDRLSPHPPYSRSRLVTVAAPDIRAASQAQKAADFILNIQPEE